MKILSITVALKRGDKVDILKSAHNLQPFSYFQRGSVREFLDFSSRLVVERSQTCYRAAVTEKEYLCHVYVRQDGLAGVIISDGDYPTRVAQTFLSKLLDEFATQYPSSTWNNLTAQIVQFVVIDEYIVKWQNPKEADALTRLQSDLDETKVVLHNTLEQLLRRGEQLDDLVARSEDLSMQSKAFYTTAKKTNRCCIIL
jgi:synaptobrevin family protein YKT6